MKNILLLTALLATVLVVYFYLDENKDEGNKADHIKTAEVTTDSDVDADTVKLNTITKPTVRDPLPVKNLDEELSLHAIELKELLDPPSDEAMAEVWSYAYGCSQLDNDDPEKCEFPTMFNAESLEEAQWMKRNGFPHRDMIESLRDEASHQAIAELARHDYKPAVALAALAASSLSRYSDAINWAARFEVLSDPDDVYVHRLLGDVRAAHDPLSGFALQSYLIAEYLGDYEARVMVNVHTHDNPYLLRMAVEGAHNYLSRQLGVTDLSELPTDPRPGGG